jgi:hypothetical protein
VGSKRTELVTPRCPLLVISVVITNGTVRTLEDLADYSERSRIVPSNWFARGVADSARFWMLTAGAQPVGPNPNRVMENRSTRSYGGCVKCLLALRCEAQSGMKIYRTLKCQCDQSQFNGSAGAIARAHNSVVRDQPTHISLEVNSRTRTFIITRLRRVVLWLFQSSTVSLSKQHGVCSVADERGVHLFV